MQFPVRLINKFYMKNLGPFLENKIPDFYNKLREEQRSGTIAVAAILNSEMNFLDENNYLEIIEESFFAYVFTNEQEVSYYKKLQVNDLTADDIFLRIQNNNQYSEFIDKKLYFWDQESDNKVVSIRKDQDSIKILFQFGIHKTQMNIEKAFFVSAKLDFNEEIVSISLNNTSFRGLRQEDKINILDLLNSIKRQIDMMTHLDGQRLLTWVNFSDIPIQKALYGIFKDESENAIKVIQEEINNESDEEFKPIVMRTKVKEFLENELLLESADEFVDKAISIKYQDVAIRLEQDSYTKFGGFIYGFGFIDKRITRSENKSSTKEPVYKSKIFWSLRDNIDEFKEIASLSMYWLFDMTDFSKDITPENYISANISNFQVQLKAEHDNLKIHLVLDKNNRIIDTQLSKEIERRELYALYKVKNNLPTQQTIRN